MLIHIRIARNLQLKMKKTNVCLLLVINCVFCSVIETPQNVVVRVGQRMSFKCRTANGSKVREWLFTRSYNDSSQIKIFSNWNNNLRPPPVDSGYGLDVDQFGSGEVYVNETKMENAGRYKCTTEKDGNLVNYEAELIVLVSDPKCNTAAHMENLSAGVKEGSNIEVRCIINYTGNLVPVAKWTLRSRRMTMSDQRITCMDRNMCYYNTTLYWNSSDKEMVFSSEISFDPLSKTLSADSGNVIAENIPEYVYKWNFSAVVWYAPKNIWIEPLKTNYKFGDQLRCFADGNPSPNITWSCVSWTQVDLTDDSILSIDKNIFNASHFYSCRCTAFSFIFDVSISATVIFTIDHDKGNVLAITLLIVVFILVSVLIAGAVAIYKKLIGDKKPAGDDETKATGRVQVPGAVYDTIQCDRIDYEMLARVVSSEGSSADYDRLNFERIPSDYEDPDKMFCDKDGEMMNISSQYLTTFPDSNKETDVGISSSDRTGPV